MADLTVVFEPPARVWSINERLHWAQTNPLKSAWKVAAMVYAKKVLASRRVSPGHFEVRVHLPFRDRRRRDPHNYTGTVVKAIVDGLVEARVFPDDTPEYVTVVDPVLVIGGKQLVTIEVTKR